MGDFFEGLSKDSSGLARELFIRICAERDGRFLEKGEIYANNFALQVGVTILAKTIATMSREGDLGNDFASNVEFICKNVLPKLLKSHTVVYKGSPPPFPS